MEISTKKCYNYYVFFISLTYVLFGLYNKFQKAGQKSAVGAGVPHSPKTILHKERII